MTTGTIWKQILLFSLPIMLGQILQQLYNTVDGIVVANFAYESKAASEAALAAVGGSVSLIFLFMSVCIGLGNGGAVIISQLYGARRIDDLRRAASTIIITLTGLGLLCSAVGIIFADELMMNLMSIQDPEVADMAIAYFSIFSGGFIFMYSYNAIAGILRAMGDSRSTLYFLILSAGMNTVLDLLFVIVFNWAVIGVAVATLISQIACMLFSVIYMLKKYPMLRYKRSEFVFDREMFKLTLRFGIPAVLQQGVISLGNVFIQRLVNSFGRITMSAFTVGMRMEAYTFIPIFAINMGTATFVGQNVGATRFDRVGKGLKQSVIIAFIAAATMGSLVYIFSPAFTALFNLEGQAAIQAVEQQRYVSMVMTVFAIYLPASGTLQGSGDAMWATVASITTLTVRVATAYALVYFFAFGYAAAWTTMPFGWTCGIVIAYSRYFSGKWKTKGIAHKFERGSDVKSEAPQDLGQSRD